MVEFIDELVSVDIQVRTDGTVAPLGFAWQGQHRRVESWGRESIGTREGREQHCYLVQTSDGETWELCRDTKTAQWTLMRHWAHGSRTV